MDANWAPPTFPNAVDATAVLGNIITANRVITLGQDITVGTLQINDNNNYTVSGSNSLTFDVSSGNAQLQVSGSGSPTISSPLILNDTLEINKASGGTLTLSGNRSGSGGLIKTGSGTLNLNGIGSYSGTTEIREGVVNYSTSGAIPLGTVQIGDGIGAANSARLVINTSMGFTVPLAANVASDGQLSQGSNRLVRLLSASGNGSIALNSSVGDGFQFIGDGAANDSTFSGIISGGQANSTDPNASSRINKIGTAILTLNGNNTFVARTFISGGAIRAESANALGSSAAASNTSVYGAGSLEVAGNITLAEVIALNGTGFGGNGALRSVSGNNTITGPVTLGWSGGSVTAADTSIGVDSGSTLTLAGTIDGSQNVAKTGGGTLRITGANSATGSTTVSGGTLELQSSGLAIAGSSLVVNSGGTVLLAAPDQIADSTNLVLDGGTFDTGAGQDETLGTLTLASNSIISLGAAIHNLRFGASNLLAWTPGAMLTIQGWLGALATTGDLGRIFFGTGPGSLTSAQLAAVTFDGYAPGATLLASGELVPYAVPDAKTVFAGILLVITVCWRERHLFLARLLSTARGVRSLRRVAS